MANHLKKSTLESLDPATVELVEGYCKEERVSFEDIVKQAFIIHVKDKLEQDNINLTSIFNSADNIIANYVNDKKELKRQKNRPITALDACNYLTNKAIDQEYPFTIPQALALTYMAQGFHLALEKGKPFFKEEVYALKSGPIIKELYSQLKDRENEEDPFIVRTRSHGDPFLLSDRQSKILQTIFGSYGGLSGVDLSEIVFKKGTPCDITYEKTPNEVIPKQLIEKHFKTFVTSESFASMYSRSV